MAVGSLLKKFEGGLAFNEIESYTSKARTWYMNELKNMRVNRPALLKDSETIKKSRALPGRMFMFFYDPKHKATLPYYDQFPLILMVDSAKPKKGFYGLNFHYLPYALRARLLDAAGQDKLNIQEVKRSRLTKPTIKRYLFGYVKSMFLKIEDEDNLTAIMLPVQRFKKASTSTVWADSRKMI